MRVSFSVIIAALLMAGCNGFQGAGPGERYGDQYRRGGNSSVDDPAYEDQVDITQVAGPRASAPTPLEMQPPDSYAPVPASPRQYGPPQQYQRTRPAPQPSAAIRHHVVRPQENLYSIGRRYGVPVPELQRANGLNDTLIRPGDRLVIPR